MGDAMGFSPGLEPSWWFREMKLLCNMLSREDVFEADISEGYDPYPSSYGRG